MRCELHLCGTVDDFKPKFDKMRREDQEWLFGMKIPKGAKHLSMNLEEVKRFLTMFNEIEEIVFEVK